MTTHSITLNLPEQIYRQLEQKANASDQELDMVIMQSIRAGLPPGLDHVPVQYQNDLKTLDRMDNVTLQAIVKQDLDDSKIEIYEFLLDKNQREGLDSSELEHLAILRNEADILMLKRSYAAALLRWRGFPVRPLENNNQ